MTTTADRPTRVAADLVDSAAVEGARQSRSAKQQLDHWTRVGRAVSMHGTAARRRVEAALSGSLPVSALTPDERVALHAEVEATVQEGLLGTHYGRRLAAEGTTTVALAEDGTLVQYHADGSTTPYEPAAG